MCGIAGGWASAADPTELGGVVRRMVEALHHRGPDDRGFFETRGFMMGMSRLSIIDVAGGHQPISNEDGSITLVCNGEIYNHDELRQELKKAGHTFRTSSDVEVLLHLYENEGPAFLERVAGMFAVAIWDEPRQQLLLARDRLGIKPLYYVEAGSRFLFASELKALVRAGTVPLEFDPVAMDAYLSLGYVPAPLTIYKNIRKLDPGHFLIRCNGQSKVTRYWRLHFAPAEAQTERHFEEGFLDTFRQAVRSHMMSEVPLGAFLSGGVDSGLVVALMSEVVSTSVRTFTIGFTGGAGGHLDERPFARMISERYRTDHTEIEVEPRIDEVLEEIVESFDEPFADDSVIPSYYICRAARRSVTVALTGLGGDELFGGYERHLGFKMSLGYDRVPALLRRGIIRPLVERLPERRDGHYTVNHMKRFVRASALTPAERYRSYVTVVDQGLKSRLLTDRLPREVTRCASPGRGSAAFGADVPADESLLNQALRFDTEVYLPDDILTLTDRLSMACGLELRVPYLDHSVVEFCATIPERLKIRGLTKKYLLRRVAQRYLPADVLNHRKQGFASPMASWIRSDLQGYVRDALSAKRLAKYGLLNPAPIEDMLTAHLERRESYDKQIFTVLMLQKWCERYL